MTALDQHACPDQGPFYPLGTDLKNAVNDSGDVNFSAHK